MLHLINVSKLSGSTIHWLARRRTNIHWFWLCLVLAVLLGKNIRWFTSSILGYLLSTILGFAPFFLEYIILPFNHFHEGIVVYSRFAMLFKFILELFAALNKLSLLSLKLLLNLL